MTHKRVLDTSGQRPPDHEILYTAGRKAEVDRMLGVIGRYEFHYRRSQDNGNLGVFEWSERGVKPQQMLEELRRVTSPEVARIVNKLSRDPELAEAFVREAIAFPKSLDRFLEVDGSARPKPSGVIPDFISRRRELGFLINPNSGLLCVGDAELGHERLAGNHGIDFHGEEYQRLLKGDIMYAQGGRPVVIIDTHQFYQPFDRDAWVFRNLVGYACRHLIRSGVPPELELNVGRIAQESRVTLDEAAGGGSRYTTEDELSQRVKEIQLRASQPGEKEWVEIREGKTVRRSDIQREGYILETKEGYILTDSHDLAEIAAKRGDNVLGFGEGKIFHKKFKHDLHIQAPDHFTIV